MTTKFVVFTSPDDKKQVLVNSAHVCTASEIGPNKVMLVFDRGEGSGFYQDVEGDLKSVWETLTRTPVDLTWT